MLTMELPSKVVKMNASVEVYGCRERRRIQEMEGNVKMIHCGSR